MTPYMVLKRVFDAFRSRSNLGAASFLRLALGAGFLVLGAFKVSPGANSLA